MKISQFAGSIQESITMAVTAKAKQMKAQGVDVVSFGAGEPDFDTPDFIKEAAKHYLDKGMTKYTAGSGHPDLKKEIARKLKDENALDYKPSQIVVTCGAKHAVYEAVHAVCDPGDEVLIPTPYWVSYPDMVSLVGGVPKFVQTQEKDGYKLTPELLKQHITDKTVMLIFNSPSNPGGFCYSPEEQAALGEVLKGTKVAILSDEIYEKLVYGNMIFQSFAAACPELYDQVITVNGLSKAYSMTGWRLGYLAGPDSLAKAVGNIQSHMTSGPATFCQLAAIDALQKGQGDIDKMHAEFAKRAVHIHQRLNALPGVTCIEPTGAFYAFPNISGTYAKLGVSGSVEFCNKLLEEAKVACVPGIGFGCDENIRLSFATSMANIDKGIDRIAQFLK